MAPGLPHRYRDVAELGRGAFGLVYRAKDEQDRPVAVKVLAPELAGQPETAWQFAGEYRKLARLEHPAFPAALDEGRTDAGLPYYAMALVDAPDLPRGPLPAEEVRAVAAGLAEALAYLHGMGLVHGDLKPENVKRDERVHLLDVGLMALSGQPRETIAGTLEYLAPEAFGKAPVAPAADMYALGVLLYELRTGQPPFSGTPIQLVRAQMTQAPAPIDDALIMALLSKDPARRPSARGVLVALGLAKDLGPEPVGLQGGSFVGRSDVLSAWNALQTGVLHLAGEPGMGKSRTLEACRLAAQLAGQTWLGVAARGGAPAAPVRALVTQALAAAHQTPSATVAAWLAGEVPAELQDLEPASRKAAFQAAAGQALAGAAKALGGLAVGLDDWHLADGASRELVDAWIATLPDAPIRWAIAAEGSEAQPLPPLSDDDATALIASRLGGPVPAAFLANVLPTAQGSPLWLHALVEQAHASGALTATDPAHWRYEPTATPAGPTGGLRALWTARLAPVGPAARRLAGVAALAVRAGALPTPVLTAAAVLGEAEARDAVDELLRVGMIVERAGQVHLAMAAAAPALLEELPAAERPAVASRLADAVLGTTPTEALPLDRLVQGTWLALAGATDARALGLATEAAARALALGSPREAQALLAAAAPALEGAGTADALAFLLARAEAGRLLDRLDDAILDYERALEAARQLRAGHRQVQALIGLAKCRQMRGAYDEALDRLDEAARKAEQLGDAAAGARAAVAEARLRLFKGDATAALACCERALALAGGSPALRSAALKMKGVLVAQEHPERADEALALLEEALALADGQGDRLGRGTTLENLGNVHLAIGRLGEAADAFRRSRETFEELGAATETLGAMLNQAIAAGELGDAATAGPLAADVAARAVAVGRKFFVGAARAVEGQAAWRGGHPEAARAPLDEALAVALEIKSRYLEEHVRLVRLEAWLALGDRDAARVEAIALDALVAATGHADALQRLGAQRAELARQQGDADAARALAAPLAQSAGPVAAHRALQILSQLDLAAGHPEDALARARAAEAIAAGWRAPWHQAADAWLVSRAQAAGGDARAALALARAAAPANPYARAGQALLLLELDDGPSARAALDAALAALRPGLLAMDAAAWPAVLEAQGLAALAGRLERRSEAGGGAGGGGLLDAARYARALGELALQDDETAIGQVALRAAMELVGAERGYFLVYEDGSLREAITEGLDYASELADGFSHSIAEEVLFSGEPLYVADASANATWKEAQSVMALGLRTVVCLPVSTPEEILGVLYMDRQAIDPVLAPVDMAFLGGFTTVVASRVITTRALKAAQLAEARADRRAAAAAAIAGAPDPVAGRAALLAALVDLAQAERGFWLEAGPDGWQALAGRTRDGKPLAFQPEGISQGIADWVHQQREPLSLLDAGATEGWQARASVQALGLRTVWCLPAGEGAVAYLDTTELALADPEGTLGLLSEMLQFALPLLGV